MGTKFAHSDKSVKLGRPYYLIKPMEALWEINSSGKSNMAATGYPNWSYLRKCLADFHYIGVNYKVFEGWQSIGEICCDNIHSFNEITQDLIKYKPFLIF